MYDDVSTYVKAVMRRCIIGEGPQPSARTRILPAHTAREREYTCLQHTERLRQDAIDCLLCVYIYICRLAFSSCIRVCVEDDGDFCFSVLILLMLGNFPGKVIRDTTDFKMI